MGTLHTADVFERSRSKDQARLVLLVLAANCAADGVVVMSKRQIAAQTNSTLTTVQRAIRRLTELGEIETVRRQPVGRRNLPNQYRILLAQKPGLDVGAS